MPTEQRDHEDKDHPPTAGVTIAAPSLPDGAAMWRLARDSGALDLNSSYAYLLFCRDFGRTSRVAQVDGEEAGFVLAYRRPERPDCLFVWQIAVAERFRGRQLSSRLLDELVHGELEPTDDRPAVRVVETTITDDNAASRALFASFARRWGAELRTVPLFAAAHFPDDHDAEPLYEIGPLRTPNDH